MHVPKISLDTVIGRRLSRRTTVKFAAGTGMATTALAIADRARAAVTAGLAETPERQATTTSLPQRWTRRGSQVVSSLRANTEIARLTELDGVALAVEWAPDGTLLDFETQADVSRDLAMNAAQYGAAVSMMAPSLADGYSRTTGFSWAPYRAVVVCGGEWAAVIGNENKGIWVRAEEADFNQLIATLSATGEQH